MAALSRMANRDHRIRVGRGDTVVLASSLIPGNENAVYRVINGLTRLGAKVVHQGNARVHVSGHASAGELLYAYNIVRPRNVLPVHGEVRHLVANAELAVKTGVPPERVAVAEDGVVVDLVEGVARVTGAIECGYVYVDGASVGEITEVDLKDRRILGEEGFISIVVVVDSGTGKVVAGPGRRRRRHAPADADRPPGRRAVGERELPAPADDPAARDRGVSFVVCAGGAVVDLHLHLVTPARAGTSNPARASTSPGGVARKRRGEPRPARRAGAALLARRGRRRRASAAAQASRRWGRHHGHERRAGRGDSAVRRRAGPGR
jgi:hypothetical protein